jgi:hypothetical protein
MTRLLLVPLTALALALVAVASTAAAPPNRVPVSIDYRLDGALFIEGSYTYFRIENAAGNAVLRHRFTDGTRKLTTKLRPGKYVLVTYERPCDGNCDYLDPPTARCESAFRVRSASPLRISVRYDLLTSTCSRTVTRR